VFEENGYTKEEMKIVWETHKILSDDSIAINPTAVRVPVFYGHSAAVHIETKKKLTAKKAEEILSQAPGIQLNVGEHPYATPAHDAAGKDEVFVGRIREDISYQNGLNLWIVADNVRKGAALNAVQIAEALL
jgi:aspartate-semialdehyde dehydrogenase